MLEQVQRTAARFVYRDYRYSTSPPALVAALGWDTLHTHRILDQCTLLYKIHHRLVSIPAPTIVIPALYFGRHEHNLKYVIPVATIDSFKFSYYPGAIRIWNRNNQLQGGCFTLHQNEAVPCWFSHRIILLAWFLLALDLAYFTVNRQVLCPHTIPAIHDTPCSYSPHLSSQYSFPSELPKGLPNQEPSTKIPNTLYVITEIFE